MSSSKNLKLRKLSKVSSVFIKIGLILISLAVIIVGLTLWPIFKEEVFYLFQNHNVKYIVSNKVDLKSLNNVIKPIDDEFGIVIPKIKANSKVITNVSPFDSKVYQYALTKGVAHAFGSSLPDQNGNVFIFAHSSQDWFMANRYNSVFYLLDKLEKNDEIDIFYKKEKFTYKVLEKRIVDKSAVNYLINNTDQKTLTLMTCWPPGTTLKRLIIVAKLALTS